MKPVAYIRPASLGDITRTGTIVGVTVYRPGYQPDDATIALVIKPEPLPASTIVGLYAGCPRCDSDMIAFARAIEKELGL